MCVLVVVVARNIVKQKKRKCVTRNIVFIIIMFYHKQKRIGHGRVMIERDNWLVINRRYVAKEFCVFSSHSAFKEGLGKMAPELAVDAQTIGNRKPS